MADNVFTKDPNATLDFGFDWSQWLKDGDFITSYTVTTACGINKPADMNTSASVIVWLSGGTSGSRYGVTCTINTSGSRIDQRTIKIDVKER